MLQIFYFHLIVLNVLFRPLGLSLSTLYENSKSESIIIDLTTKQVTKRVSRSFDEVIIFIDNNGYLYEASKIFKKLFEQSGLSGLMSADDDPKAILLREASSNSRYFAQVVRYYPRSSWISKKPYDVLCVYQNSLLENCALTVDQVLFFLRVFKGGDKTVISACANTNKLCTYHNQKHFFESKIFQSLPFNLKYELIPYITYDQCQNHIKPTSRVLGACYRIKKSESISSKIKNIATQKITLGPLAKIAAGAVVGAGLGYTALNKLGLHNKVLQYSLVGLAGVAGGILGGLDAQI